MQLPPARFLDEDRWLLHNRAVHRLQHRRVGFALIVSWALGPVLGLGAAAHQFEHHDKDEPLLSGMIEVVLHGHFHEDDTDDHGHEVAAPALAPSLLSNQSQAALFGGSPVESLPAPAAESWWSGVPPEQNAIGPPTPFGLCVLRL